MSVTILSPALAQMAERGRLSSDDVLSLRQTVFADGVVSENEADNLFRLNAACRLDDPSWTEFFVEALTDYVVHQAEPHGYVTAEKADWLIERISQDGKVETATELELVVNVLEKARWSPPRLQSFALQQVKVAVVEGEGPVRQGETLEPGVINQVEVDLLRRILYAFAGDGNIAITRQEAELLFAINDVCEGNDNHPDWPELFVKAIANYVMGASGYKVPTRQEALKREEWLKGRSGVGHFLKKMVSGGVSGVFDAYQAQTAEERALERLEQERVEILIGEQITFDEAQWLIERIEHDGKLTANERALLAFIDIESPEVHPSLKPLIERAQGIGYL